MYTHARSAQAITNQDGRDAATERCEYKFRRPDYLLSRGAPEV